MVQDPMAVFAFCAAICAGIYWSTRQSWMEKFYSVVPAILLVCYIPAVCTNLGVIPAQSPAYVWMSKYLLPFSLFLLTVTTDVPSALLVGRRAILVMLFGTVGVIVGGPVAFWIFQDWLPVDTWKGVAAISGSWIGGGANFAAIKESVQAPDGIAGAAIIVDATIAFTWMGVLIYLAKYPGLLDRLYKSDSSMIEELNERLQSVKEQNLRTPTTVDVIIIVALGLVGAVLCSEMASQIYPVVNPIMQGISQNLASVFSEFTWVIILVTAVGIIGSFTRIRNVDTVGGSTFGYAALYLFFTSLGAQADLGSIATMPVFLLVGVVWLFIHICFLVLGGWLLRAPMFLVAVSSEANMGGVATAPVVASAYYKSMAPVGLLMGIFGGLIGTYCGLACAYLLKLIAS
jgi:uncharacterized membrane protein